jgi:hypothetical protein
MEIEGIHRRDRSRRTFHGLAGAILFLIGATASVAVAQQSTSYRLTEHALNAGGRPADGVVASSTNYRVSLESIGDTVGHGTVTSASYAGDGGFVPPYAPPVEVDGLRFTDKDTLIWHAMGSARVFNLYRDGLSTLGGLTVGTCLVREIPMTTTDDATLPPPDAAYVYLLSAVNRLDEEGTLGAATPGDIRVPTTACP